MLGRWAKLYRGTPAELALEPAVASLGVRYRTQYPLFLFSKLRYFPDFVLLDWHVVIEVDDPGHARRERQEADRERTKALRAAGWTVVRCENEDALRHPYATVNRMMVQLGLPLRAERRDPPPAAQPARPPATPSDPPPSED